MADTPVLGGGGLQEGERRKFVAVCMFEHVCACKHSLGNKKKMWGCPPGTLVLRGKGRTSLGTPSNHCPPSQNTKTKKQPFPYQETESRSCITLCWPREELIPTAPKRNVCGESPSSRLWLSQGCFFSPRGNCAFFLFLKKNFKQGKHKQT